MSSILFSIQHGIASITLNRPDKFNSFDKEMAMAMQEALDVCAGDEQIRCVLITGNGKAFCAGQDLAEATSTEFAGFTAVVSKHYNPIIRKMRNLPKPIVVAVNGVAAGAGANIALAGDIVVAHENASFIQAFSKIGLVPDSGGTFILPRLIGMQRASALMMLGDKVSAAEALQMGMLYKVYNDADYATSISNLVQQVAAMPTQGLVLTKQLLNQSVQHNLAEQLQAECDVQTLAGNTKDYAEGVASFLEKRKPNFTGQ
jgi:2-(1,2-epoxy-1,2-dihydrophenyl)acetyl-CoA isomerase